MRCFGGLELHNCGRPPCRIFESLSSDGLSFLGNSGRFDIIEFLPISPNQRAPWILWIKDKVDGLAAMKALEGASVGDALLPAVVLAIDRILKNHNAHQWHAGIVGGLDSYDFAFHGLAVDGEPADAKRSDGQYRSPEDQGQPGHWAGASWFVVIPDQEPDRREWNDDDADLKRRRGEIHKARNGMAARRLTG